MTEERRARPRFALNTPARIRARGGIAADVRLIDLSTHGCRLETTARFHRDDLIWLRLPGVNGHPGSIIWCRDGFVGIAFSAPLHASVVDQLLRLNGDLSNADLIELCSISKRCSMLADRMADFEDADRLQDLARDCRVTAAVSSLVAQLSAGDQASH